MNIFCCCFTKRFLPPKNDYEWVTCLKSFVWCNAHPGFFFSFLPYTFPKSDIFQFHLGEFWQALFVKSISLPSFLLHPCSDSTQEPIHHVLHALYKRWADDGWNLLHVWVFMARLSHTSVDPMACSRVLGGKWALIARGNGMALQGGFYCSQGN